MIETKFHDEILPWNYMAKFHGKIAWNWSYSSTPSCPAAGLFFTNRCVGAWIYRYGINFAQRFRNMNCTRRHKVLMFRLKAGWMIAVEQFTPMFKPIYQYFFSPVLRFKKILLFLKNQDLYEEGKETRKCWNGKNNAFGAELFRFGLVRWRALFFDRGRVWGKSSPVCGIPHFSWKLMKLRRKISRRRTVFQFQIFQLNKFSLFRKVNLQEWFSCKC